MRVPGSLAAARTACNYLNWESIAFINMSFNKANLISLVSAELLECATGKKTKIVSS